MNNRFDDIAPIYDAQIPEHVRLHLLHRKVEMMVVWLGDLDRATAVGLDLGCGTGWHVKQLHEQGFVKVFGLDNSKAQLAEAQRNVGLDGAYLCLSDIRHLPCANKSIDFAYAINVIHHLKSRAEQRATISEINRVMKVGGLFFLHEINTTNPIMAFYMNYVFPRLKLIDDGLEKWLIPEMLLHLPGFELLDVQYFTFVPDFTPKLLFPLIRWLEKRLESTALRCWGGHYMVTLRKVRVD